MLQKKHDLLRKFKHHRLDIIDRIEIEILLIFLIISIWTIMLSIYEKWHLFDALYFSIITLSSVGYGDIHPISIAGKLIAMIYAIVWLPLWIILAQLITNYLIGKNSKSFSNKVDE